MYRGPGGMNPPPFRLVYGEDQVYTPDLNQPNRFAMHPNRCFACRSQHEHDIRYRVFLRRLLNHHCHPQGPLDLFDMGEGTFGCRAEAWFHANYEAISHFELLPNLIPMGGGGNHGGPRRPPGLRRGGFGGPINHGRQPNRGNSTGGHSGGALVRRHTGGAFGGGPAGGATGGAFGGAGAARRNSRGAQSSSAASPPTIQRAQTMTTSGASQPTSGASQPTSGASGPARRATLPAAPPTKRYGDAEDMATR